MPEWAGLVKVFAEPGGIGLQNFLEVLAGMPNLSAETGWTQASAWSQALDVKLCAGFVELAARVVLVGQGLNWSKDAWLNFLQKQVGLIKSSAGLRMDLWNFLKGREALGKWSQKWAGLSQISVRVGLKLQQEEDLTDQIFCRSGQDLSNFSQDWELDISSLGVSRICQILHESGQDWSKFLQQSVGMDFPQESHKLGTKWSQISA